MGKENKTRFKSRATKTKMNKIQSEKLDSNKNIGRIYGTKLP